METMTSLKTTIKLTGGYVACLTLLSACGHMMTQHPDNQAAISARQNAMKAIGAASAALRNPALDAATARSTGMTINQNLKVFAANLPKGSGPESGLTTKAKSEIWTSSPAFNNALNAGLNASQALATTTGEPATVAAQARALNQACAGCHTTYRT
jgi:cytochrome c556